MNIADCIKRYTFKVWYGNTKKWEKGAYENEFTVSVYAKHINEAKKIVEELIAYEYECYVWKLVMMHEEVV